MSTLSTHSSWRLIPPIQTTGAHQMAIDAWLLDQHRLGLHLPTLRFYGWSPVAISLGYHQRHYPDFWRQLTWRGNSIDLVRRPSGGRAVLHQGDLTYAVITSGIPGTRMQAYQTICKFLIEGWRSLGVDLHYGDAGRGYIHNPNCFGSATGADLVTSDGIKLIGSAQLRRGQAILQHGSIRLSTDPALFRQVFQTELPPLNLSPPLPLPLPVLEPVLESQDIIPALTAAAADCFSIQITPQPLTELEWQEILSQSKLPD